MNMNISHRRNCPKVIASSLRPYVSLNNMFFWQKITEGSIHSMLLDTARLKGNVQQNTRLIIALFNQYFTFLGDDKLLDDPRVAYDCRVILDNILFKLCGNDLIKEKSYLNTIEELLSASADIPLTDIPKELILNTILLKAHMGYPNRVRPEHWNGLSQPDFPSRQVLKIAGEHFWDRRARFKDMEDIVSSTLTMFKAYLSHTAGGRENTARDIKDLLYYPLELALASEISDQLTFLSELYIRLENDTTMFREKDRSLLLNILHPLFQDYKTLAPREAVFILDHLGQAAELLASGILLLDALPADTIIVTMNGRGAIFNVRTKRNENISWMDVKNYRDMNTIRQNILSMIPLLPEGSLSLYMSAVMGAFFATLFTVNTLFGLSLSDTGVLMAFFFYSVIFSLPYYPRHLKRNTLIKLAEKTWNERTEHGDRY